MAGQQRARRLPGLPAVDASLYFGLHVHGVRSGQAREPAPALRRILQAERSATLGEALRILEASRAAPRAHLLLFLVCGDDQAIDWLQSDLAKFFEEFSTEFPRALHRSLGENVGDVKPRWAKGTANRVSRMLSDHISELQRKDEFLGNFFAGERESSDV